MSHNATTFNDLKIGVRVSLAFVLPLAGLLWFSIATVVGEYRMMTRGWEDYRPWPIWAHAISLRHIKWFKFEEVLDRAGNFSAYGFCVGLFFLYGIEVRGIGGKKIEGMTIV